MIEDPNLIYKVIIFTFGLCAGVLLKTFDYYLKNDEIDRGKVSGIYTLEYLRMLEELYLEELYLEELTDEVDKN